MRNGGFLNFYTFWLWALREWAATQKSPQTEQKEFFLMWIDFTEAVGTRVGRRFPAGDLRRTQPITSKADVRGGEEGSGEEAEGARQTREKKNRWRGGAEERQGADNHGFGSAAVLTSDWLRWALWVSNTTELCLFTVRACGGFEKINESFHTFGALKCTDRANDQTAGTTYSLQLATF